MSVIVINRSDRPRRLIKTLAELRKVKFARRVTRIEACLPDEAKEYKCTFLDFNSYQNIINNQGNTLKIPTWGALACAISHRRAWAQIRDNPEEYGLIVEDDLEITDPTKFMFCSYEASDLLNNKYDVPLIVLFGSKSDNNTKINDRIDMIRGPFIGCHCYLLNKKAASFLLEKIPRFEFQIDIELGLLAKNNKHVYLYNYPDSGAKQSDHPSDVQIVKYDKSILSQYLSSLPINVMTTIISFLPTDHSTYSPVPGRGREMTYDIYYGYYLEGNGVNYLNYLIDRSDSYF